MNETLARLAREVGLDAPESGALRLAFGHACATRVRHLLEDPEAIACLDALGERVAEGGADLPALSERAARIANAHPGSRSLDGVGHAAVSATYAVANALAGKPLQAADYAAYAMVYGSGGYGAVADRTSFEPEFNWQAETLRRLACGIRR